MNRQKKVFLIQSILLTFSSLSGYCQPPLLECEHGLRAGDSLTVQTVEAFSPGTPGPGKVWDLRGLETYAKEPAWICDDDGLLTLCCLGTLFHYKTSGDTLQLSGLENRRVLASLSDPLPLLRWPVSYGDSMSAVLSGGAEWCGRLFMTVRGVGSTSCDASGTLILPGGDTLRNVMRIHSRRQASLHEADSVRTWDTLARLLSAGPPPAGRFTSETHDTYLWLAPGCRYPVAALLSYETPKGSVTASALLCPPGVQYAMEQPDPVNESVRQALQSGAGPYGDGTQYGSGSPLLSYTVSQDPSSRTIHADCSIDGGGTLSLVLTDAAGVVYDSLTTPISAGETYSASLSYARLPRGQFILHLSVGAERHTEKFTNS